MSHPDEARLDTLFANEQPLAAPALRGAPTTSVSPPARPQGQRTCADYSEEAIPERDPAYCLADATLYATQTVAHLSAAERRALARCLHQLGMSRAKAAILASL